MSLLLYFRLPHDASLGAVEVSMDATVSDLVAAVREAASLDRAQIAFRGEPLGAGSEALADIGLCPESVVDVVAAPLRVGRAGEQIAVKPEEQTITDRCGAKASGSGCAIAADGWTSGTHTWYVDVMDMSSDRCFDFGVCTDNIADINTCPIHNKYGVYSVRAFRAYTGNSDQNPASFGAVEGEWPQQLVGVRVELVLDCDAHTLLVTVPGASITVHELPDVRLYPCVGFQTCSAMLRMHNDPLLPLP
eukprot:TRINITY_DN3833_c0_g1_i2.p2 TRINITY_DN3833_c0_g1~~TRINITY_DN3833_c0_g1_i2.p2  ORF type:complete len:248 (+),score=41.71 TRINITY_DN3833_c0_g1_i2:3-746(+)